MKEKDREREEESSSPSQYELKSYEASQLLREIYLSFYRVAGTSSR